MLQFQVEDMTCGHCASTITKAIKEIAPTAAVTILLDQHLVKVDTEANPDTIMSAIRDAGYTPVEG